MNGELGYNVENFTIPYTSRKEEMVTTDESILMQKELFGQK